MLESQINDEVDLESFASTQLPLDPEYNRTYSKSRLERVNRAQIFNNEQVASLSKWLTASLLAVNGAAALGVLNAHDSRARIAGVLFAGGVIFALLGGAVLQEIYIRTPEPLKDIEDYWIDASITGHRSYSREAELKATLNRAYRFNFLAPLMGWISGILFAAGALSLLFD